MNSTKTAFIAAALLSSGLANAQWSANLGFASDYFFRGIYQSQSSASGGIDYENNGFYAGVWAADVGDGLSKDDPSTGHAGLEVDGYFGYGGEVGDFSYGIGYTGYFYTDDFDDTYQEINLSGGYGIATVDVAIGKYDDFTGPEQDYTYYSLTLEKNGCTASTPGSARTSTVSISRSATARRFLISISASTSSSTTRC